MREQFIEATGREPQHDDLERCNCQEAGCGWNRRRNKPQFEIGPQSWNGKGEERMIAAALSGKDSTND